MDQPVKVLYLRTFSPGLNYHYALSYPYHFRYLNQKGFETEAQARAAAKRWAKRHGMDNGAVDPQLFVR